MLATLSNQASRFNPKGVHNDVNFLHLQLQYLHKIIPNNDYVITNVTDKEALSCSGNFYKLLGSLGIPSECFWLSLHLNGMTTPSQFTGKLASESLLTVSPNFVKQLAKEYSAKLNMN